MSLIVPSDFLKWCQVFGVITGGGGAVTYPITMPLGGTGANLTPTNNALFYSTATNGALLPSQNLSVLSTDASGNLAWSTTLPTGIMSASPSASNQVANKAYVDAVAAGLTPAPAVYAASTANLTGYTYDNGTAGEGATLTAGTNGAFTLDGVSVPLNESILYKNDTAGSGAYNGIYILTTVGDGSTPAVLTRATYYDNPVNINNSGLVPVVNGTVNAGSGWILTSIVVTVGTTPLVYTQFGQVVGIIPMANGGSGASLAPSNGGIVYSDADSMEILAGTATAGLPLLSGASSAPEWGAFGLDLGGILTTAGAVTFAGAFSFTGNVTGITDITFPESGLLAAYDANLNLLALNFIPSITFTTTSNITTILTNASEYNQFFEGSQPQVLQMPDVTTLARGWPFRAVNNVSSNAIFITAHDTSSIVNIQPFTQVILTCISDTDNSAAGWSVQESSNNLGVLSLSAGSTCIDLSAATGNVTISLTQEVGPGDQPYFSALRDSNNNTVTALGGTPSAVNYLAIINATTGNGPRLIATGGSDPDIGFRFEATGSGIFNSFTNSNTGWQFTTGTAHQHNSTFVFPNTANSQQYTFPDITGNIAVETQGTFTPTFTFTTPGDLSVAYGARAGTYHRIGNIVFYIITMAFTPTFTTSSGAAFIGGLPVTVGATFNAPQNINLVSSGFTYPAGRTSPASLPITGSTTIILQCQGSNVAQTQIGPSNLVSGAALSLVASGFYFTN